MGDTKLFILPPPKNVDKERILWSTFELNESPAGEVFLLNHDIDSGGKFKKGNKVKFTDAAIKKFEKKYGFSHGKQYTIVYGPDSDNDIKVEYTNTKGKLSNSSYIKASKENLKPKTRDQWNEPTSTLLYCNSAGDAKFDRTNEMKGDGSNFDLLFVGSNPQTVSSNSIVPEQPSNANSALWTAFEPIITRPGADHDSLRIPTLKILDDVADTSSGAVLNFQSVHLSLQEFLCADYLAEQVVTNRARFAMDRTLEFMDWDYNSLAGVKALFEEPRHKNMLKFLGQLGAADQMLEFQGEVEDPATRTWDAETGVLRFTKWKLSSGASERMITFTAGSILAGRATKLILTGCHTPGLTGDIMLALSRFGFLEELDMRRTTKLIRTSGGSEAINDWQLTWREMVTAVRDAHHPTLQRVFLQENVGALMRSNPDLFPINQIKRSPGGSTFEEVEVAPKRDVTGESPPKVVRRKLGKGESKKIDNYFRDEEYNAEYLWSRGWEVPVISGKCRITFIETNPPRLAGGGFSHQDVGGSSAPHKDRGWIHFGTCSSLDF